ncbi:MAG TPA: TMEM175 family protein [Methanoregulaceae archaeon]|nr:TMEM175 family protein [Methanoregulaceae archaeon]
MDSEKQLRREGLAKSRIEALSDGIFAISMTLLVLSLTVPNIPLDKASELLPGVISGLYSEFLFFAIAFFILGGYWLAHHRILHSVKYVDERLIWINILLLFFVVLIPFTTTLSGDYPNVLEAVILFHFNLLVASLLLTILWTYVRHNQMTLMPERGKDHPPVQEAIPNRVIVIPGLIVLAIAVSFVDTHASMWCYILIPISLFVLDRLPKRKKE